MSRHVVTLYGRPGCHLCDDARAALVPLAGELGFTVEEVDIESDDELFKRYLERIPVGLLDGDHLFDFFIDVPELRRRLTTVGER
ncbi:MAG: glutaredoxin family protein [Baekduia sp.]